MKVVPRFAIGNAAQAKENIGTVMDIKDGEVVVDVISKGKHVTRVFGPEDLTIITGYATSESLNESVMFPLWNKIK
jgi:hypothetical protein